MFDSNTFDYIYDNGLTSKVQNAVDDGKLQLFATDVQKQELEKIPNDTRKQAIRQTAEEIRVEFKETSGAVVALDQPSKKGFIGSRVDKSKVISDEDEKLLKKLKEIKNELQPKSVDPLKDMGDILTLFTAIEENMDLIVTNDADFKRFLERFKEERDTKIQTIDYKDFEWGEGALISCLLL
jgi:predicted nucleic acid-binding protein